MGELESVAKAKKELEEIYLGVPDDSVNLTFQDLARLTIQNRQSSNPSVDSLCSDDNKLEIDKPICALAKLPSLDFKQALEAPSRYPTHNHNHSYSSRSPQQNHPISKRSNLPTEKQALKASSRYPTQNHNHSHSFHSPQQNHPLQEKSNVSTENPVKPTKSHSYHCHYNHHGQTMDGRHRRHHHQHRKQILQRGHGGEAHGNHATDVHDVSHQHHGIPCHDSTACRHVYDNYYDTMSRTSEMTTGSASSATATPPYQGRRRPGTPHSNICTLCSTHVYIFRHRCLVCGRVYCRQCVRVGMGEMSEGRKCVECLGRRFSQRYIQRAGQIGCCIGYPSIVKQQELKWAEKGPKRSRDSKSGRTPVSISRSPAQTSPIRAHYPSPTPSFGMDSPYSPYTPTRHSPLPL